MYLIIYLINIIKIYCYYVALGNTDFFFFYQLFISRLSHVNVVFEMYIIITFI